jgi:integrase
VRRLYGHTSAADFDPLALKAVRADTIPNGGKKETSKTGGDLCRTEVNKRVGKIVRMFKWAVENELVSAVVYQGLKAVAGLKAGRCEARESKPVKPVPMDLVDAVPPLVTRQVAAMAQLKLVCGARPSEMVRMRRCDLDMSGDVWTFTPMRHKTPHHGHGRVIYLGPKAQAILTPWLRPELEAFLFSPAEAVAEKKAARRAARKTKVQPSQADRSKAKPAKTAGDRYTVNSYRHAIQDACDKTFPHPTLEDIKPADFTPEQRTELKTWRKAHCWHPHQLRHNAGTYLRSVCGPDVARTVLGQRTLAAAHIYCEADLDKAKEAIGKGG